MKNYVDDNDTLSVSNSRSLLTTSVLFFFLALRKNKLVESMRRSFNVHRLFRDSCDVILMKS